MTDDGLTKQQRYEFRLMAEYRDVVERVIAESTDEDPATRAKVLRAIRDARGQATLGGTCVCPDCGASHRRKRLDR